MGKVVGPKDVVTKESSDQESEVGLVAPCSNPSSPMCEEDSSDCLAKVDKSIALPD